jgi:hypothetical protein
MEQEQHWCDHGRLPRVTRAEALAEYAKVSELGLPESERRGLFPAGGCEVYRARALAETGRHPIIDEKASTTELEPVDPLTERCQILRNDHDPVIADPPDWMPRASNWASALAAGFLFAACAANFYDMRPAMWACVIPAVALCVCALCWRR